MDKRTSLSLGDKPVKFNSEFKVGFHFNFYMQPLFGTIISISTNDGHTISVVASHQGNDAYMLGLVIDEKMELMKGLISLTPDREDFIDVNLDKNAGIVTFRYNNNELEMPLDLSSVSSVSVTFGVDTAKEQTDVAPIELRNVRFFVDNVNTNWWDFKYHDSPDSRNDEIAGVVAQVKNPHWLIDDHTDWTKIYSTTVKDKLQTAFDPVNERFLIVGDKSIKEWHPLTGDSTEHKVAGGIRPMAYSNHLVYDTVSGNLINYNLNKRTSAKFDFQNGLWKNDANSDANDEASYANHAFAIDGNTAYTFGGYGFYRFRNDLFKIDLTNGTIEECPLRPEMMPTTSAAAAVVDDKLYIFGGKGNISGRQELPTKYNYALYAYDTSTWEGNKVWEIDSLSNYFLPSQTMYYDNQEDCFYAASTRGGGQMIRISRQKPDITILSTDIGSKMEYHDFVFDLFQSKDGKRYYLLIDKRLDPTTHDYSIYTISAPFIDNPDIISHKTIDTVKNDGGSKGYLWFIIGVLILLGCLTSAVLIYRAKKRKSQKNQTFSDEVGGYPVQSVDEKELAVEDDATLPAGSNESIEELQFFDKQDSAEITSKFDRSKSAISLLGNFNVMTKNGEDISSKFTDRLKSLLILLLLSNEKNDNGIKYQRIDEQIWGDKDEKSAQNNRNVYMRKLRLLLEEVGDVPITYEKGYFKIRHNNITFDYSEAVSRMKLIQSEGNASPELINDTLDLLLMGPLLPMTTYDWLDQYKADFSDWALEILSKLLHYEINRNDKLAFKIAQTISLHEPLSEEAMKAKCILLNRKKMVGQAQKIYNKFCKEYSHSLGEEYKVSFPDVCKSKI
ncbi:MAG: hypothetical protein NC453_14985 [Muribaculum sp.]|nr:hypothetical protein [Muribaculum sp.]